MPMIMDMNMDDLFGDAQSLLAPIPVARGLLERLDELRLTGCCRRIAWSRLGCIAYTNRDGLDITVQNLYCNSEDGKWALSKAYPVTRSAFVHEGHQVVHLLWSSTGSELAVVDLCGRISIFSIYISINRFAPIRPASVDTDDELSAIVGLYWLNNERQFPLYKPVVKSGGQWLYHASTHKYMGPYHPVGPSPPKAALVGVTRNGVFRLLFQQPENRWGETRTDLETVHSSNDLITHASICSDKDHSLLLVVSTVARHLRVYRIYIKWNLPQNHEKVPPNQLILAPTLLVRNIKSEDKCFPRPLYDNDNPLAITSSVPPTNNPLSHLEFIPPAPETRNSEPTFPTILAIFSNLSNAVESSHVYQDSSSIVVRWELHSASRDLHSSFDHLISKKPADNTRSTTPPAIALRRLDDVVLNDMVVSVHQLNASTVIALALSAGSITFLDRASMKIIMPDENHEKVSSMPQSGFVFANDTHCLDVALSPNFCLAVSINADGEPALKYPQYALGSIDEFEDIAKATAAKVVLALQWVYSCTHHNNNDDVLAIVKRFFSPSKRLSTSSIPSHRKLTCPELEHDFLAEVYDALQVNVDYAADGQQDKLLRYPWIQRCLSMQYSLDYKGETEHRSIAAKLAWTILNMRVASLTYAFTFNAKDKAAGPGGYGQWARPETMPSLLGVFAWQLDVMNFIIDELYSLKHLLGGRVIDRETIKAIVLKLNTPALSLLLASSSRGFVRYNLRAVSMVASGKMNMSAVPVDAHNSFMDMIESSPISIPEFEHIIIGLDNSVRSTYEASGISDAERALLEKDMIIESDIPEVLMPVVERLLTTTLEELQPQIDRAALYFKDVSWLGLSDDRKTQAYRKNNVVDAIRKVPLGKGTKLRRCTRCCAMMEDVSPTKQTSAWMHGVQRMCFCGCLWMLL
ncbi:MAG: mediator complex subunit [Candelina mexicana]|nr:MAG: mediator complex subunit [Candelina mexicana]